MNCDPNNPINGKVVKRDFNRTLAFKCCPNIGNLLDCVAID